MKKEKKRAKSGQRRPLPLWMWIGFAAFAILLVLALTVFRPASQDPAYAAEISVSEAAEKRAAGAFILDVREPDEWEEIHIPDATLIPLGALDSRLNELPRDQEVVVVCRSGNRSQQGRDILKRAGFERVTSMKGGMQDWQAQGFPTTSGK